ncbi:hypothetical protein BG261_00415 [Floricoccus tropicus]|uniref:Peptidase C39-like domain-containing protein n=1 Tax=Floricoccus tropicus TaxID=1859473 RepID=A0A1E8GQ58_9LACT|nr:C39 family peptidase [Floricoccus tropicus]OFI50384.1 hypothetical protein BG261_00415 [Floricoccus tropicus]
MKKREIILITVCFTVLSGVTYALIGKDFSNEKDKNQKIEILQSSVSSVSSVSSSSNNSENGIDKIEATDSTGSGDTWDEKVKQKEELEKNGGSYPDNYVKENPPISDEIADKFLSGSTEENNANESNTNDSKKATRKYINVNQQIQQKATTCAPTAVSMILSTRGKNISQDQLALEMGTTDDFGTHNKDAIRVLNKHLFGYEIPANNQDGYRIATVKCADQNSEDLKLFKERVKENIDNGYPLYYTIDNSRMYDNRTGEHNLIGNGYLTNSDGTDIEYIYYIDPSPYMQDAKYGGLKKVTPKELLEAMIPCMEPNYAW